MRSVRYSTVGIVVLVGWISGCDSDGPAPGTTVLLETASEGKGKNCEFGGQRIDHGLDADRDGELSQDEVNGTIYACNGASGDDGAAGEDGAPGKNGARGEDGEDGIIGKDGGTSLVEVEDESAGENCASGGKHVTIGIDADADGALAEGEVTSSFFLCNGDDGAPGIQTLVRTAAVEPGERCVQGGQRTLFGADLDRDGELHENEVEGESVVCNGVDGLVGLKTLVRVSASEPSEACPAGGQIFETGIDTDRSDALSEAEVLSSTEVCNGQEGLASLVSITAEAAGANCAAGGSRVQFGIDADRSGALQEAEIEGTRFVCNGTNGSDGFSTLVKRTAEPAGVNCAQGGQLLQIGLDNGDGSGTPRNGAIEAGEIDSSAYLCNGADGADGADGEDGKHGSGGVGVQDGNGAHIGRVLSLGGDMMSNYSFLTETGHAYSIYYYDLLPMQQTFYYANNDCTGAAYTYSSVGWGWSGSIGKFAAYLRNQGWMVSVPNSTATVSYASYRSDANDTCYAYAGSAALTEVVPTTAQALGLPDTFVAPLTFL